MLFTRPLIHKSFGFLTSPLLIVLNATSTIGITATILFHCFFFQSSCKVLVLIILFAFVKFPTVVSWNGKIHYPAGSLFLMLTITRSQDDPFVFKKKHRIFCVSILGRILGWAYIIYSYVQISISCTITSESPFPPIHANSYTFFANLLLSLIMGLIVSSLSPRNLHLWFRFILSIFVLTSLILMISFCAAVRRDSISPFRFPKWKFSRVRFHFFVSLNIHTVVFLPIFVFCYFVLLMLVLSTLLLGDVISFPLRFLCPLPVYSLIC